MEKNYKTKGGKYSKMQCVQKWIWVMNVLLTNRRLRPSIRALGATQQQATIRHVAKRWRRKKEEVSIETINYPKKSYWLLEIQFVQSLVQQMYVITFLVWVPTYFSFSGSFPRIKYERPLFFTDTQTQIAIFFIGSFVGE